VTIQVWTFYRIDWDLLRDDQDSASTIAPGLYWTSREAVIEAVIEELKEEYEEYDEAAKDDPAWAEQVGPFGVEFVHEKTPGIINVRAPWLTEDDEIVVYKMEVAK
jgi:hypothetical protein